MSIKQAQAFIKKVQNDEELAMRLSKVENNESKLVLAKKLGYDFTLDEARQACEQLSEEELDHVTAGFDFPCIFPDISCKKYPE